MSLSDVVVLPSIYREGVPRSLIEALALGKYIITTDKPGCKETVYDGWNGSKLKSNNVKELIENILITEIVDLDIYKKNSRLLCEKKFDVRDLFEKTILEYEKSKIKII